ncbi:MAG: 1-deoxy-D-xylulose-5-phosphate synthase [Elusimicrobiota bacterium]
MDMILDKIDKPEDLRIIDRKLLNPLVDEIRKMIITTTAKNGGHLAPSLGVVELTVALHYTMDTPEDKIIWDVGHQAYAHKIITGRRDGFTKLRQLGGISGFPNRSESEFDAFGTGHSSTSISAALGIACARDHNGDDYRVIAVIGDGALTGGLAFEGLNNAGHLKKNMLVILNDNEMFISGKVGALGEYLTRLLTFEPIYKIEEKLKKILQKHPKWGEEIIKIARRSKVILTPGMFFEELGFEYFGPVDGHDLDGLIHILDKVKNMNGPVLLHVITKKGKGYKPAENNPEYFHGTSPFDIETGEPSMNGDYIPKYQDVFGDTIVELAKKDKDIIAITAAMTSGTGLSKFKERFPKRFYDVGIAEQHALTFAAGAATQGLKPVCAIYSTFLQRAYDQIIHDIALQGLPVILAIDRAGLVGEDGPTHHGIFDLSFISAIPNMVVAAPSDEIELRNLLYSATKWNKPTAIRYPRGNIEGKEPATGYIDLEIGKGRVLREGSDMTIMAIGTPVNSALHAAKMLSDKGIQAGVIDLRFAKPLDTELIIEKAESTGVVLTVEENIIEGGVGERVLRIIGDRAATAIIAIPDSFISCGTIKELHHKLGLDPEGICNTAQELLTRARRS